MVYFNKLKWVPLLALACLMTLFYGCQSPNTTTTTDIPDYTTQTDTAPVVDITVPEDGMSYSWQGFPQPALKPEDALILIEKIAPKSSKPGKEFELKIRVSNRAMYDVDNIMLEESLPSDVVYLSSSPKAEVRGQQLNWEIGSLDSGESELITIKGKTNRVGTVRYTGSSELKFEIDELVSSVEVIEPALDFNIVSADNAVVFEEIPAQFTFTNSGSASVSGVRVLHTLPKGLLTNEGKSRVDIPVGDLDPQESKTVNLSFQGEEVGFYETTFTATAADGISTTAMLKASIRKPNLQITAKAPDKRFVGNIITYDINVKNVGDAAAKNTLIRLSLPENTSLASANEEGQVEENAVVWRVGNLQPGEIKKVTARLIAKKIMTARAVAYAEAVAADPVEEIMVTDIAGIAALLMELVDVNDPVPVGETEIYEITAKNTGSLPATRIVVKCELENSMEFVKSSGATKSSLKGSTLSFEPLPALEPQAEAAWRVIIRAKKSGDIRFKISVESDQLTSPVIREEPTNFYE